MGVVKDECSKSLCWRPLQLSGKKKNLRAIPDYDKVISFVRWN